MDDNLRREIMIDNYQNPFNKVVPQEDGYIKVNTSSESCIDNVVIFARIFYLIEVIKDSRVLFLFDLMIRKLIYGQTENSSQYPQCRQPDALYLDETRLLDISAFFHIILLYVIL